MRKGKMTRGVAAFGLLAASFTFGSSIVAASSGSASVKGHVTPTYNVPSIATRAREFWPYVDPTRFTVTNVSNTQQPQWRPLYWFGLGSSTTFQSALSLASKPVMAPGNKIATITLKGWKFYNALTHTSTQIQAKNIEFWLNLAKADPAGYGGYTPGYGIPDQVLKTQILTPLSIRIYLKSAVNPTWFLYNALASITPLPSAWDTTDPFGTPSAHMVNCEGQAFAAVVKGAGVCNSVYNAWSDDTNNYAADNAAAIWHTGYSGPYMVDQYHYAADSSYIVHMIPNPGYSGPVKAHVNVQFHFFSSLGSEVTALEAGNVLNVGTVSPSLVNPAPSPGTAGSNKDALIAAHYNTRSAAFWGFDYAYINFSGHATHQALLKQEYIRAALVKAVNQKGIITTIYNGYAVQSCSPLPFLNDSFAKGLVCPYPYSVSGAKLLLTGHGWTIANPAATCTKATGCGAGIPKGTKLNLNFEYITAAPSPFDTMVATEKSEWASVGLNVTLIPSTEAAVSNDCLGGVVPPTFDICEYGGWVYSPGAYPSGEQLFLAGAASNSGLLNDATMNTDIVKSISTSTSLLTYAKYSATFVPVMYQPSALGAGEIGKTVVGVQPINPIADFNPEYITAV